MDECDRDWLRRHWDDNPLLTRSAYEAGLVPTRVYLDHTRRDWLADLDRLLASTVAATLSTDEALRVVNGRHA